MQNVYSKETLLKGTKTARARQTQYKRSMQLDALAAVQAQRIKFVMPSLLTKCTTLLVCFCITAEFVLIQSTSHKNKTKKTE